MESSGVPGKVNISEKTKELIGIILRIILTYN